MFDQEYYPHLAAESNLYQDKPNAKQMNYIRQCVSGVYDKKPEIDGIIEQYAVGWKLSRISKVSLAVLRLAIYEILYVEDAPAGAVINEAVEIGRRYEEEATVSFTTGIFSPFVLAQQ